jgi:hypothetical protein
MEEPTIALPAGDAAAFDLGEMLGRRQAFGTIAGRCSAADAECLRRIRDQKLYLQRAPSWDEFCPQYLGLSRTHANRIVKLLEEFGPAYFELAQLTRITAEQYRAIAPAIRDRSIHAHGEAIALIPENAGQVAAAVAALRREAAPPAATVSERLSAVEQRCNRLADEFRQLLAEKPAETERLLLQSTIRNAIETMERFELDMGL